MDFVPEVVKNAAGKVVNFVRTNASWMTALIIVLLVVVFALSVTVYVDGMTGASTNAEFATKTSHTGSTNEQVSDSEKKYFSDESFYRGYQGHGVWGLPDDSYADVANVDGKEGYLRGPPTSMYWEPDIDLVTFQDEWGHTTRPDLGEMSGGRASRYKEHLDLHEDSLAQKVHE